VVEEAPYVSEFWGETKSRAERVFIALEALDAAGELNKDGLRDALETLQGMGLRTRDTAIKALESPHAPSVGLAAQLLRSVGDMEKDDARLLVEIASGVGNLSVAAECLDAAVVIDGSLPVRAVDLLAHPRRQMRTLTEGRLRSNPDPDFVPGLARHLRAGRDADIKVRAARILGDYVEIDEARGALRGAVGDDSVSVAFAATDALSGTATEAQRAYIREELRQIETGPELAYLVYALLRQQEVAGELLVDEELVGKLRPLIQVSDPFLSGVSAAAVAEYVFRTDLQEDLDILQRALPNTLVKAVGGTEFYPQYARFSPLAEQSLRRISGQDFTDRDRRAWIDWYAENRNTFSLVRGRMELRAADLPMLEVSWFTAEQPLRAMGGIAAIGIEAGQQGRVLGPSGLARLEELLQATEVLESSVLPGTYGLPEDPIRAGLEIRVQGRRKPVRFRGASAGTWVPELLKNLDLLYREQSWQVIAAGGDETAFLSSAVPAWDQADAAARSKLLASWHRERILMVPRAAALEWSRFLTMNPEMVKDWPADAAPLLLQRLAHFADAPADARVIVDAATLHRGAEMVQRLVNTTIQLEEPLRSQLMSRGLGALGVEAAASALKDERLLVQVAAAQALSKGGAEAVPTLIDTLDAGDPLVIRVALQSLGQIGDLRALKPVEGMASPGMPRELRKAAVAALGGFGEAVSVDLLLAAANEEDVSLRLAALSALRKIPGAEADGALSMMVPRYLATSLESSYAHALELRGAAFARQTLVSYLGDRNRAVARRAAILSGRLGEPAAVPRLMTLLSGSPNDREILESLAHASCVDYRTTPDPAGVYEIWWRDHQRQDPSLWLLDGLEGREFELVENFVEGSGASRATIVRNLIEVLEAGPRYMRPAAALYLTELTAIDVPAISPGVPIEVVRVAAQPWRDWLAGR